MTPQRFIPLLFAVALVLSRPVGVSAQATDDTTLPAVDPQTLVIALAFSPVSFPSWPDGAMVYDTSANVSYPAVGEVTLEFGYPEEERSAVYQVFPSSADAWSAYDAWVIEMQGSYEFVRWEFGLGEAAVVGYRGVYDDGIFPGSDLFYYLVKVDNVLVVGQARSVSIDDLLTVEGYAGLLAWEGIGHLGRVSAGLGPALTS